jgi:5-methylcytosine-specific restriction endonuclease McrA
MNCLYCGKKIIGKKASAKYCSEECLNIAREVRKGNPRYISDSPLLKPRPCQWCGEMFTPSIYNYTFAKYCSKTCCSKACSRRSIESGKKKINRKKYLEKNVEVKHKQDKRYADKIMYSGNREKVLKRDGYKCTKCGSSKSLVVHHKDETGISRVKDTDLINNEFENLITMCRSCHMKLHFPEHKVYKDISKEAIEEALENNISVELAAKSLGITRKTLLLKRKAYGLPLRENVYFTK